MRKLMLELEALEVETFETTDALDGRGTVDGHQLGTWQTRYTWCAEYFTCPECAYPDTNDHSCPGTCAETCPDTCAETCGCGSGGTGPDIQNPV